MNGGFQLAVLTRAVLAGCGPQTLDPVAVSAQFLRATSPGPAMVRVVPVQEGRTVGVWRAELLQGGRVAVDATVTTGALDDGREPLWSDPPATAPFLRGETGLPRMRMWTRPGGEAPDLLFCPVACDIAVPTP